MKLGVRYIRGDTGKTRKQVQYGRRIVYFCPCNLTRNSTLIDAGSQCTRLTLSPCRKLLFLAQEGPIRKKGMPYHAIVQSSAYVILIVQTTIAGSVCVSATHVTPHRRGTCSSAITTLKSRRPSRLMPGSTPSKKGGFHYGGYCCSDIDLYGHMFMELG